MTMQITMRRNAFVSGSPRVAGQTYTESDSVALDFLSKGWAVLGPVYGQQLSAVLAAPARTGGNNPTLVGWESQQGAQVIQFTPTAVAAGDVIVVAWSTVYQDETNLGALVDAMCDDIEAASSTGIYGADTRILTTAGTWAGVVFDGTNTIKTLVAVACKLGANTGATAQRLILDLTI